MALPDVPRSGAAAKQLAAIVIGMNAALWLPRVHSIDLNFVREDETCENERRFSPSRASLVIERGGS